MFYWENWFLTLFHSTLFTHLQRAFFLFYSFKYQYNKQSTRDESENIISPASGRPSLRITNVLFFSWSRIAIFVGVLRYILSNYHTRKRWSVSFNSSKHMKCQYIRTKNEVKCHMWSLFQYFHKRRTKKRWLFVKDKGQIWEKEMTYFWGIKNEHFLI